MSKAKKSVTKTNRSQAGIINVVGNISNVVGYSNVLPFLEYDASNIANATNSNSNSNSNCNINIKGNSHSYSHSHSTIKRNKDTCMHRKHCNIIDKNISSDVNGAVVIVDGGYGGNAVIGVGVGVGAGVGFGKDNNNDENDINDINNAVDNGHRNGSNKNNNNNNNTTTNNKNKNKNTKHDINDDDDDCDDDDDDDDEADAYVDADTDSLASMETLSDNVAIWVDGERHWISGVDANTTCMDLIFALLNYQNGQQMFDHGIDHGQDNPNAYHDDRRNTCNTNTNSNTSSNNKRNLSNNNCNIRGGDGGGGIGVGIGAGIGVGVGNNTINQSMPSKEGKQRQHQESVRTVVYQDVNCHGNQNISNSNSNSGNTNMNTNTNMNISGNCKSHTKATLERNIALASEYVIVKQHRHCEEYLDGNAKVFDVLPTKTVEGVLSNGGGGGGGGGGISNRKECELFLRRLVSNSSSNGAPISLEGHVGTSSSPHVGNTQVASLLSTDKDSGMGSPVGSSRSARFRRRKHKSATWLSQGNTLHPKATQRNSGFSAAAAAAAIAASAGNGNGVHNIANERLMRIILAQDETIHRQLSMIREKERQISKIEEEKHRVRERELGKNYLLETYFKGLDEAACEPNNDADEEIFIDEPYQRMSENVEGKDMMGTSQHHSSRHNKKFSNSQHQQFRYQKHRSNQLGNNTSSAAVKANNLVGGEGDDDDDVDVDVAIATSNGPTHDGTDAFVGDADVDVDADVYADVDNQKEIEMQIFWLEKVYALNKQLQREEETLLKLHAKIRKHQVRCAYQMKNDVLEQIDELDAKLALQCANICRVEDNLVASDEQLKGKLNLLEKLNAELEETQEVSVAPTSMTATAAMIGTTAHVCNENDIKNVDLQSKSLNTDDVDIEPCGDVVDVVDVVHDDVDVEISDLKIKSRKRKPITEMNTFVDPMKTEVFTTKHQSKSNKQITSDDVDVDVDIDVDVDECNELQNMTTRTCLKVNDAVELHSTSTSTSPSTPTVTTTALSPITKLTLSTSAMCSSMLNQQQQTQQQQQKHQHQYREHREEQKLHNYPISRVKQFEQSSAIAIDMKTNVNATTTATATTTKVKTTTMTTQLLSDKNMLPQHAPNVKIVKKPMYEALSLNQMPSSTTVKATGASVAVMCQQKTPSNKPPTMFISSPMLTLNDDNGMDLSHLGTLV